MEFTPNMFPRGIVLQSVEDRTELVERFVNAYSNKDFEDFLETLYSMYKTDDESKYHTGNPDWSLFRNSDGTTYKYRNQRYMHQFGEIRNLIWRMITRYHLQYESDSKSFWALKKSVAYWYIFNNAEEDHLDWQRAKKDLNIHLKSRDIYTEDPRNEEEHFAILYIENHKKED